MPETNTARSSSDEQAPDVATREQGRDPLKLERAIPNQFPFPLPRHWRFLAWTTALIVPSMFYIGPLMLILPPFLYLYSSRAALLLLVVDALLVLTPIRPWPRFRRIFQLWYELFDFHHNLALPLKFPESAASSLHILAMHPHGVIPIQGMMWTAFCDQYMNDMYGFGAAADATMYVPLVRQILGWLSAGSASRYVLQEGLEKGQNLFILPGGIAEIFLAHPGRHVIKAQRRGLMKLALQTGAALVPVYVFGGNDFYHHLATKAPKETRRSDSLVGEVLEKHSRSFKTAFTIFWGQYGLPLPYPAKCTMVLADPIWPVPNTLGEGRAGDTMTCRKVPEPTTEQIEELMDRYTSALSRLFDQYKAQAGYPDARLEIQ